jgi:hypothetical protein
MVAAKRPSELTPSCSDGTLDGLPEYAGAASPQTPP